MSQQYEMFTNEVLNIKIPEELSEPRFWVRRLKIWEAPGGKVVRDIKLRPGLNIIWSPDGDDDPDSKNIRNIGHGSGKTLFCRMLRYCLGETRYADEIQRNAIAEAFLNGVVGAEVMLDGVCWAIARPLGIGRKHFAIAGADLDNLAWMKGETTGIEPLIDVVESTILKDNVAKLARLSTGQKAWPIALAWLARDQECRFDDVLYWRSPSSGSHAPQPASGEAKGPRLLALRAFLKIITEEEQICRQQEIDLVTELDVIKKQQSFLKWDQERCLKKLISDLDISDTALPEMPLLLTHLESIANQKLASASGLLPGDKTTIADARQARQKAQERLNKAELAKNDLESRLPLEEKLLSQLCSEIPGLSSEMNMAKSPMCPVCEVPLDKVLADNKCPYSDKVPDAAKCRDRLDAKRKNIIEQEQNIANIKAKLENLKPELALALQAHQLADERLSKLVEAMDLKTSNWRTASRIVEDVQRYADLNEELLATKHFVRKMEVDLEKLRDSLRNFEEKQAEKVSVISGKFSAIIQNLVGKNAKGLVRLSGRGLETNIDAGGNRRTAAIESLKVLAFDLAALVLSMEGNTHVPAFLIHDSPREADLGLTIYNEYFKLVRKIEETAGSAFQYIITTTTRPPDELNHEPWRRLIIRGTPGSERLLMRDL